MVPMGHLLGRPLFGQGGDSGPLQDLHQPAADVRGAGVPGKGVGKAELLQQRILHANG